MYADKASLVPNVLAQVETIKTGSMILGLLTAKKISLECGNSFIADLIQAEIDKLGGDNVH